jgi:hypothetical protein
MSRPSRLLHRPRQRSPMPPRIGTMAYPSQQHRHRRVQGRLPSSMSAIRPALERLNPLDLRPTPERGRRSRHPRLGWEYRRFHQAGQHRPPPAGRHPPERLRPRWRRPIAAQAADAKYLVAPANATVCCAIKLSDRLSGSLWLSPVHNEERSDRIAVLCGNRIPNAIPCENFLANHDFPRQTPRSWLSLPAAKVGYLRCARRQLAENT